MKIDYENLFKRLLMLNQRGVYLQGRDGLNLGYGGVDASRIDKVNKGKGGLY